LFIASLLIALPVITLRADGPKIAGTAIAGQRVFYTGHSFHMFVPAMIDEIVKTTDIKGHKVAGTQGIGGSKVIQHWELGDDKNKAKPALIGGQVDVFTMAPHLMIPDEGISNFVKLGLEHNADMRFVIQCSWYPFDVAPPEIGATDKRIKDNTQRDSAKMEDLQSAMDEWRTRMEKQVDALNQQYSKRCAFIVPVGDAVVKLRAMVQAGQFPGITEQSKLFRDAIGHGQGQIMALAAYCDFAAIYGMSPEGHPVSERSISAEQHKVLQKLAWDTVSNYSYAGVKKS
jgi:hypothetical protein